MSKYKCAMYLRLSQEDLKKENKEDESSSISSQRMIIQSFSKFNNLEIIEEYVDDGYSGGNFDRPAFKRLIEDIEKGKINCVITKDLSRLGREIYRTGTYIEEYFLEKNVRYIAIHDSYDSEIGDNMLGLRLSVNDLYLRDISKKVRSSLKAKQQKGDYIGTYPCYGYKKDPNNKHHLIKDENVECIVRKIYHMALEGYSICAICEELTKEKIPIPIVYKKEKRGYFVTENSGYGIWKYSTVKNILTSQMYIGNMVQHTYSKISYRSKKIKKSKDEDFIIVENTHEPIVSKEEFEKIQNILKSRSKFTRGKEKKYLFTGILKCRECGHTISISERTSKNNEHYTQCNLYRKKGKYGLCTQHRMNYTLLEKDLIYIIRNICKKHLKNYNSSKFLEEVNNIKNQNVLKLEKQVKNIELEISKIETIIEHLYMDKYECKIEEEMFKKMFEKQKERLKNLKRQQIETKKIWEKEKLKTHIEIYQKDILSFMCMDFPTHKEISQLVKKVTISENKTVEIYFQFKPLNTIK